MTIAMASDSIARKMGVINHILLQFLWCFRYCLCSVNRYAIGGKSPKKLCPFFFFSLFFFLLNTFESRLVSKMGISVHLGKGQALKDLMCALRSYCCCSIWRSFRMMWHATCWSSLFFTRNYEKCTSSFASDFSLLLLYFTGIPPNPHNLFGALCKSVRWRTVWPQSYMLLLFFVCVCFLCTEFLALHKQKACYFRVTIFVGINREKRACIYIPAGMARDYSSFNLEVCQNKEHQQ